MCRWSARFASGRKEKLVIGYVKRSAGKDVAHRKIDRLGEPDSFWEAIATALDDVAEPDLLDVERYEFTASERLVAAQHALKTTDPALLVVESRDTEGDQQEGIGRDLFDTAGCPVLLLHPGGHDGGKCDRVLIPVSSDPHTKTSLQLGENLLTDETTLVPFYVEPASADLAVEVGENLLGSMLSESELAGRTGVEPKVVLNNRVTQAILEEATENNYDILLMGAPRKKADWQRKLSNLPEKLLFDGDGMAAGIVRRAHSQSQRWKDRLWDQIRIRVPHLEREQRVKVFTRLQTGSHLSSDFVILIALSTAIAALGLLLNSTAVVIGAMLVAPLMTPILGAGLALVQGNFPLMRSSVTSIVIGFFCALVIGAVPGILGRSYFGMTDEILARGGPNLLDLGVAFFSGLAAAYCLARPNLTSALAGVAIAAALVPPIATVGLAGAFGEWQVMRGAVLLFVTNVVTIILGAGAVFHLLGLRARKGEERPWVRRMVALLLAALVALSVPLSHIAKTRLPKGFVRNLTDALGSENAVEISKAEMIREKGKSTVCLEVTRSEVLPLRLREEIIAKTLEHVPRAEAVRLETRLVKTRNR